MLCPLWITVLEECSVLVYPPHDTTSSRTVRDVSANAPPLTLISQNHSDHATVPTKHRFHIEK